MSHIRNNDAVVGESRALRVSSRDPDGELLSAVAEAAGEVPVAAVGATGAAGVEPLLIATDEGVTRYYYRCSVEQGQEVARALASGWTPPGGDAAVEHEARIERLPATDGPLAIGERSVLGRAGWVAPASVADHEASGGLAALDVAGTPEAALDGLGDLAGRGWGDAAADEPIADQWRTARTADGDPAVVVNAHGSPTDRLLLESAPLAVLEGALVAAAVVGASEVYVYVNETDRLARGRAEAAATAIVEGTDATAAVDVVPGPDEYKAAEPTMAMEAIEGNHRLEARRRPPGPAEYGLFGRPTLVHTPRTLARVERVLAGDREPTRLVTVTGDVAEPATVELPESATLAAAVDAVEVEGAFKAACVGGQFGGVTADLDVAVGSRSLTEAGLGSEGVVEVLAEGRCLVAFAGERAAFAEAENCGRCVPCREGSTQLARMLREVYDGEYEPDAISELARVMTASSICGFGVDASRPATTAIDAFEAEFRAHAAGSCPTGACDPTDGPDEWTDTTEVST